MSSSAETLHDLSLARGTLDRAGVRRRDPDLLPSLLKNPLTRVVALAGGRAQVIETEGDCALALRSPEPPDEHRLGVFLGEDSDGTAYVGVVEEVPEADAVDEVATTVAPTGTGTGTEAGTETGTEAGTETGSEAGTETGSRWRSLREIGAHLSDRDAGIFVTVQGLANWHASHTHCPLCGLPTVADQAGWIRRCAQDGSEHYPRTDPAVIMTVTDADDRLLLARNPRWPEGRLSVLAGFVEPGESLEAAVAREVFEEVGVVVEQVRYLGNQPWPFPSSLMVGFTARALDPSLHLDQDEIVEAMWVTRDELRQMVLAGRFGIAPTVSIARRMIEQWYGGPIDQKVEPTLPYSR